MSLQKYNQKRKFQSTPEPEGVRQNSQGYHFVVQKHHASHLHYDFRLEMDGVLKSWAVPKGPSMNPEHKRLAMMVEDHPLSYMKFEGTIPKGNYGAGEVLVWDFGVYRQIEGSSLEKGKLKFVLLGEKLKGGFSLIQLHGKEKNAWLLIKEKDEFAVTEDAPAQAAGDPMPHHVKPMLAKLVDKPFDKENWFFEIKWDGYRAIAEIEKGSIKLYSRNGLDFKEKYPPVVKELEKIGRDCVLDGEIVALHNGAADFHTLQQYQKRDAPLLYMVFDLLYLDGQDVRDRPLRERKEKLRTLLGDSEIVMFSEHVENKGLDLWKTVQKKHIEGIVAKDADSSYLEGVRGNSWLKIKNIEEQEAIIIGFTEPRGSRKYMGALVLGAYMGGALSYIGHSGGGFTETELSNLVKKLKKIKTEISPVREKIKLHSPVTWVKPLYVCEVKFTEWTADGRMRHPIYVGLREDKNPKEVVRELPEKTLPKVKAEGKTKIQIKNTRSTETPARTNVEKVFWPQEGYTKDDLLNYYDRMADIILPYQKDRPQNLLRHPNGIGDQGFFQKDITFEVPDFVELKKIWSESNNTYLRYLLCQNKETLLYMANLGCIELNPWNSRLPHLDKPDYMILDLDPSGNSLAELILVAKEVHTVLEAACEEHFLKTSGKRGLHVCIPLGAKYTYDQIKTFAEILANVIHRRLPLITSVERSPSKRKGKIYIDYLQNRRAQTLASVYSVRPYPGATVSTPLTWAELTDDFDPKNFNIKTIFKRLEDMGDIWKPILSHGIDLRDSMKCLLEHFELE